MINFKNKLSNEIYSKILFYANSIYDNNQNVSIFIEDYLIPFKSIEESMENIPLVGTLHLSEDRTRFPRTFKEKNIKLKSSMKIEQLGIGRDGRVYQYNKFSNRDMDGIKFLLIECHLKYQNVKKRIILRHFIENEITTETPPLSSIKIKNNDNIEIQPIEEFIGLIGSNSRCDISLTPKDDIIYLPNEYDIDSTFNSLVNHDEEL
ncbi:hypothetical protein ACTFIU_007343 [Dictyostelium citrinum]